MPPPPTPTHPANQAYFNTILNPSQSANAQPPSSSSASPSSANKAASSSTTTPTHASNALKTPRETEKERMMRSAQARNKTYGNETDEGGRQGGGSTRATVKGGAGRGRSPESFDARQKREWAGAVLASLEMVIWYAGVRNESLSQTRTYFQNIVLGLPEPSSTLIYPSGGGLSPSSHTYPPAPPIMWREEWEVPEHQRVRDRDRSRDRDRGGGGGDGEDTIMGGTGSGSPARREKGKGKKRVSSAGSGLD